MRRFAHAAIALFVISSASFAQQPPTWPGRSQSPGQQAVDTAACYADANRLTRVNMARESQRPPPPSQAATMAPRPIVAPAPVNPPLPAAISGASGATAASAPSAASGPAVAGAASGASGAAATLGAASGAPAASGAITASAASAPMPASGSLAEMPPPPPPEPPMVRYWRAYAKCMQQRGYFTR